MPCANELFVCRHCPCPQHPEKTNVQVGYGIAIVKLWPLEHPNAARSTRLLTGFAAPTIDTVTSHVSARGRGPDVQLLVGEDQLAAATVNRPAVAAAAAAAVAVPTPSASTTTDSSSTPHDIPSSPNEDTVLNGASDVRGCIALRQESSGSVAAAGRGEEAVDSATVGTEGTTCGVGGGGSSGGGGPGDSGTGERCIALELEIFACGAINVPRLIEVIKGRFQQVCWCLVPAAGRGSMPAC